MKVDFRKPFHLFVILCQAISSYQIINQLCFTRVVYGFSPIPQFNDRRQHDQNVFPINHFTKSGQRQRSSAKNEEEYSIDYQADINTYGRGEMHLSAALQEGDVVVYQIGTWEVDGVEVGDGNPSSYEYCVVDTMQLVWTHNCEHGFISGIAISILPDERVVIHQPLEFVDFGPEQLIARLPVSWTNEFEGQLRVTLADKLKN